MAKRPTQKNASSIDPARDPATVTARMEERIRRLEQERDAALDRLRQAERAGWTLEALMDYIPEGITIADAPDVRIRLVSRYGQELTGRPEEFTNGGVSEPAEGWGIFRPDGTPANKEELPLTRAVLSGEVVRNEEWLLRRPDGREIIVLCNAGPIRDSEGRITGGVVAWRDINQLRLTMRTLQTVTEYRLALDSARLGTWEYDYVSARFFLGERCRSFFGTMEQGIEYGRFLALFHPEDRPDLERAIRQAAAADLDGHFTTELRVARPDGSTSWLLIHAQAVFAGMDESQRVVRLIGTVMDITDRKEAEQALREREERFRGTFENAAVGIAHVALDGHFLRMNQRFCDMLGYPQIEMVERRFQDLTHPEDLADDVADAERLRSGAIDHYSMEKRYLHRDGLTVWMNMTRSLQRNDKGEPLYFITVIEDISSRKEAEAALKESQERLSLALNALRGGSLASTHGSGVPG